MRLSKSELILLRYLDGSAQGERVPNYFQYTHNLDTDECLSRFLQDNLLCMAPMAFVLGRSSVAELKDTLDKFSLDQKGKKSVLIDRLHASLPESVIQECFPAKYYALTQKGHSVLGENLSDADYYSRYPNKPTYTPEERKTKRLLAAQQEVMNQQLLELAMKESGLETLYRIISINDERTCSACRLFDNMWLEIDKIHIGINFPPFKECTSEYCRCFVVWETFDKPVT